MKQSLLLVDPDERSRRVLEVSLRKAGFTVATSGSAEDALTKVTAQAPDLILADTKLPGMDGFAFIATLRKDPLLKGIPFMFLSSDTSIESKVRGLELGVEYLTKPMYIREVITRVTLEIERRQRKVIELKPEPSTRFAGALSDMGLVDLLQTIDLSRKSGTLRIRDGQREGYLWFRDGQVVDAEVGRLRGEAAVYRFLVRSSGTFELTFGEVVRPSRVNMSTQGLLLEGMRRIDEWGRVIEQLPPLESVLEVQEDVLMERLADLPDTTNAILKLVDGRRPLASVLEEAPGDDLEVLRVVSELYFEGLVTEYESEFPRSSLPAEPLSASEEETSPRASIPVAAHSAETQRPPAASTPPRNVDTMMFGSDFVSAKPTKLSSPGPKPARDTLLEVEPPVAGERPTSAETPATKAAESAAETAEPKAAEAKATETKAAETSATDSNPPRTGHTLRPSSPSVEPAAPKPAAPGAPSTNVIPFPLQKVPVAVPTILSMPVKPDPKAPQPASPVIPQAAAVPKTSGPRPGHMTLPGVGVGSISRDDLLAQVAKSGSISQVNLPAAAERDTTHDGETHSEKEFFSKPPAPVYDSWVDLMAPSAMSPESKKFLMFVMLMLVGVPLVAVILYYGFLTAPKPRAIGEDHSSVLQPTPPPVVEATPAPEEPSAVAEEPAAPPERKHVAAPDVAPAPEAAAAPAPEAAPAGDYASLLASATALEERRKFRNAEKAYQEAIAVNPNGADALANLAFLLLNRGRNADAADLAKRATAADPSNSKAWITLGASLQALGKSAEAKSAYEACSTKGKGAYVRDCRQMLR